MNALAYIIGVLVIACFWLLIAAIAIVSFPITLTICAIYLVWRVVTCWLQRRRDREQLGRQRVVGLVPRYNPSPAAAGHYHPAPLRRRRGLFPRSSVQTSGRNP
jgi:hypothetical protein